MQTVTLIGAECLEGSWQEIFQKLEEFLTTKIELPPLP